MSLGRPTCLVKMNGVGYWLRLFFVHESRGKAWGQLLLSACLLCFVSNSHSSASKPIAPQKALQAASSNIDIKTIQARASLHFKRLLHNPETSNALQTVLAIQQDRHGFMWLGGEYGLARYDGHQLKRYLHEPSDPTALPSNAVWCLTIDNEGVLWIGTNAGLSRYDLNSDSFVNYRFDPQFKDSPLANSIRTLAVDADNQLLIGSEPGFSIFNA